MLGMWLGVEEHHKARAPKGGEERKDWTLENMRVVQDKKAVIRCKCKGMGGRRERTDIDDHEGCGGLNELELGSLRPNSQCSVPDGICTISTTQRRKWKNSCDVRYM